MGMQMLKIKAHPEVYEELEDSRTWYDEKAKNLGVDFLKEVDNAIERIRVSLFNSKLSFFTFFQH